LAVVHSDEIKIFLPHDLTTCTDTTMGWTTLYITGKTDFRDEVREKLDDSNLKIMPGYTGTSDGDPHDLYWVDDNTSLREVKEAIGSKLIWKYRLHFYASLEEFIESQNKKQQRSNEFTPEDLALIAEMQAAAR
jgi:hypothetical protein